MKIPVVKEWGSWIVFLSSCFAALIAASTQIAENKVINLPRILSTALALAFLINSKNPLSSLLRVKSGSKEHLLWFIFFVAAGMAMLSPLIVEGMKPFLLFSIPVMSYVILLSLGKEHSLITELNGFALLTLTAPVVYLAATGKLSLDLYIAVMLFFGAGVFKVRVRLKKSAFYRWMMVFYIAISIAIYYALGIPVILLLPLLENLLHVIHMREETLRATGYIEMTKGIAFLVLTGLFWS